MGLPRITYPIAFNGRTFSVEELRLIQTLTTDYAALGRTELAATLCELVDWRRPTGRLKIHEGRLLLAHLEAKGLVTLPPVRALGRRGPRDAPRSAHGAPAPDVVGTVRDVLPLALEIVPPGRQGPSRLWRELIGRLAPHGDHTRMAFGMYRKGMRAVRGQRARRPASPDARGATLARCWERFSHPWLYATPLRLGSGSPANLDRAWMRDPQPFWRSL
jgi:hypothetical protein